jgi:hypothetical protein
MPDEEMTTFPANDDHVRRPPGGVGAVRRAARLRRQRRQRSLVALLLGVVAIGAASSPSGWGPGETEILAEASLERSLRADVFGIGQPDSVVPATTAPAPAAPPSTAAPAPAAPAPPPVDQAIVAPASFNGKGRARTAASRAGGPGRVVIPSGPKAGGVWAVIIGIDDYPGEGYDLKAGTADARDVDSALAHYGVPSDRRVLLLDRQASATNIRRSLVWLAANASPDATVVFFFSGHIRQVTGFDDGDSEQVDEAMVAADGVNVFDGEAADILRRLEARTAWIGVAGCYGSGLDDMLAPGRVMTAAAAEPDLAYENSALGHSYLVEYMVRRAMLQGAAPGSVQDAFNWARNEIAREYPNRVPVMIDQGRGPLVLGAKAAPAPAPPAPAPAPKQEQPPAQSEPSTPQPTAPQPGGSPDEGACTEVLGVGLCQQSRARNSAPYRPAL